MTKADLIEAVVEKLELPRTLAERAVNLVFDEITSRLQQGDKVNISGFGTFVVSDRKARQGRNPKTGDMIDIPASKAPKFRPGKSLKDALN